MRRCCLFLLFLATVVLASSAPISATTGRVNGVQQSIFGGRPFLRGRQLAGKYDANDANAEERAIADAVKGAKTKLQSAKVAQITKAWAPKLALNVKADRQKLAWLLRKPEPPYDTIYKMGVHPDQVYQALGLKKAMLNAWDYRGWTALKQSPEYIKWRHYQQFWSAMNTAA